MTTAFGRIFDDGPFVSAHIKEASDGEADR